MENYEFEKLVPFNMEEMLKYESNSVVLKHILNEKTGNIKALALDYGKVYEPKPTPFSTFIKIMDGKAELVAANVSTFLKKNDAIIIPGHTEYTMEANERFKMLSIILKSGSDDFGI